MKLLNSVLACLLCAAGFAQVPPQRVTVAYPACYVDGNLGHDPQDALSAPGKWGVRGRSDLPFKTIAAANRASQPGDAVYIRSADYATDTILSFSALRNWQFDYFAHVSDGCEGWIQSNFSNFAQQTQNIIAFIDPTLPGYLWQNSGATTQTVIAGQAVTVGTPQAINGLTVDPAGNWAPNGTASGGTWGTGAMSSVALASPTPWNGVFAPLVIQSSAATTQFNKTFTPPANGFLTLVGAAYGGTYAAGKFWIGCGDGSNCQIFFYWTSNTNIYFKAGSGGSGGNAETSAAAATWYVFSGTIGAGGAEQWWESLSYATDNVSKGTHTDTPITAGGSTTLDLNGNAGIGQTGLVGSEWGPVQLLSLDSRSALTNGNANYRILWQNYDLIAIGAY